MQRHILDRMFQAVICVLMVATLVFFIVRLTGDPLDILTDPRATVEDRLMVAESLGLDKPLIVQYWRYMSLLVQGDFGESFNYRRSALSVVLERLPATIELTVAGMFLSLALALPIGIYSAARKGGVLDVLARTFAYVGQAAPLFWTGIMGILLFSVELGILPSGGRGNLTNLILPACTLGWVGAAGILRLTRSSMLEVLDTEYIKLARANGLSEQIVIWKHALKNAVLPVLTFSAMLSVMLLGGAVVTETVFSWPGVGRLIMRAVLMRDFPVVQAGVIVLSVAYISANLLVDVLYAYLNPKIEY